MTAPWLMRVARPTDRLDEVAEMYAAGLGFSVLDRFVDHDGFDGIILGHPGHPYHIEFTQHRTHPTGGVATPDHLLVFYVPDRREWEDRCARMLDAGFRQVPSYNPYWDVAGKTFEDLDHYCVVLENAAWSV